MSNFLITVQSLTFCLISKIIERVVKSRLRPILITYVLNHHQSAYRRHHSTETSLLYIHDHLITAIHRMTLTSF